MPKKKDPDDSDSSGKIDPPNVLRLHRGGAQHSPRGDNPCEGCDDDVGCEDCDDCCDDCCDDDGSCTCPECSGPDPGGDVAIVIAERLLDLLLTLGQYRKLTKQPDAPAILDKLEESLLRSLDVAASGVSMTTLERYGDADDT
jgi:hypothetical protein